MAGRGGKGDMLKRIEDTRIQRAAAYIRVSTEEQAQHGLSLQAQRDTLERYVKDNHLRMVDVYADEGVTARKKYRNRTEFMRMLDDVKTDKIDVILFIKLDRWFRNVADYYEVQRVLDDHSVSWIATEEDYDTTTANGRLHLNIKLSIAQDESDRTSERIKFVFAEKRKRGEVLSGKAPFGYKVENKRLAIDQDTAPLVKEMFAQYVTMQSIKAVKRWAMDAHGLYRTDRSMRLMLQNEKYAGKDGHNEPIVDIDTFNLVQDMIASRSQRHSGTKREYVFTGLAYCAECGGKLSAHTGIQGTHYYRCTRYPNKVPCTHTRQTSGRKIEDWAIANIADQIEQYNVEISNAPPKPRPDVSKIKRKMEKLKDLYLNDLIDRDVYERDYSALRDQLTIPGEPDKTPIDVSEVMLAMRSYKSLSVEEKREMWSKIIRKIIITNDNDFFIIPR